MKGRMSARNERLFLRTQTDGGGTRTVAVGDVGTNGAVALRVEHKDRRLSCTIILSAEEALQISTALAASPRARGEAR